jgi:hypothetical protein
VVYHACLPFEECANGSVARVWARDCRAGLRRRWRRRGIAQAHAAVELDRRLLTRPAIRAMTESTTGAPGAGGFTPRAAHRPGSGQGASRAQCGRRGQRARGRAGLAAHARSRAPSAYDTSLIYYTNITDSRLLAWQLRAAGRCGTSLAGASAWRVADREPLPNQSGTAGLTARPCRQRRRVEKVVCMGSQGDESDAVATIRRWRTGAARQFATLARALEWLLVRDGHPILSSVDAVFS